MVVRIGVALVGLIIAGLAAAWLMTGKRRYLQWSVRVFLAALGVALLLFAGLFVERLLGP